MNAGSVNQKIHTIAPFPTNQSTCKSFQNSGPPRVSEVSATLLIDRLARTSASSNASAAPTAGRLTLLGIYKVSATLLMPPIKVRRRGFRGFCNITHTTPKSWEGFGGFGETTSRVRE